MAAATTAPAIDLTSQSTWALKLGTSITAPKAPSRFSNVRFNYQPRLKNKDVQRKITAGARDGDCEASIIDGQQEWKYDGSHEHKGENYVLILSEENGQKAAKLEKIDQSIALNVIQTPSSSDSDELRRKYAQISMNEEAAIRNNDEADPHNPYDFRNYLHESPHKDEHPPSTASTPLARTSKPSSSSKSQPSKPLIKDVPAKKRKSALDSIQQKSKRAKKEPVKGKTQPTSTPDVPEVRITRKATERHTSPEPNTATTVSDADSGELILENDEEDGRGGSKSKRPSSMAMALSGQLGPGPISLHSAASSPASHINTPGPESPRETTYEFDFGGDDSDDQHQADDEDADVEDLELPSPVQDRARHVVDDHAAGGAEDDDDLEEQLARAMAEEEPAGAAVEEESEEE